MDNIDTIVKVSGVLLGLFASWKAFQEISVGKKSLRHEEFRFLKEFIEEISRDAPHPLLIEQGAQIVCGKLLQSNEIKYLLGFSSPSKVLRDYAKGNFYLKYDDERQKIDFKPKYINPETRREIKRWAFVQYFSCILLLIVTFIIFPGKILNNFSFSTGSSLIVGTLGALFLIWASLKNSAEIEAAERVIKEEVRRLKEKKQSELNASPKINSNLPQKQFKNNSNKKQLL